MSSDLNLSKNALSVLVHSMRSQQQEMQCAVSVLESRLAEFETNLPGIVKRLIEDTPCIQEGLIEDARCMQHDASGLRCEDKAQKCEDTHHGRTMETLTGQRSETGLTPISPTGNIVGISLDIGRARSKLQSVVNLAVGYSSEYSMEQSIWELVLFIGLKNVMNMRDTLVLALCFLVNAAMQFFVCDILTHDAFQESPFAGDFFDALQAWRLTDAHSDTYADPVRTASLASRVCNQDRALTLSTNQQNLYFTVEEYMSSEGEVLAIVAIIVWTCCCAAEMRKCLSFLCALLNVPRSGLTKLDFDGQQWHMKSILRCRALFGILVFFTRMTIAVILLRNGSRWLAYTESVQDLLLNASALAFVMEIDELIYDAFVPLRWEQILRDFKPLVLSVNDMVAPWAPQALFIVSVVMVLLSEIVWLSPHVKDMQDLQSILCGGEKDFVYGIDALQRVTWIRTAPYGEVSDFIEGQRSIVNALIRSDMNFAKNVSIEKLSGQAFNLDLRLTQSEFADRVVECRNYAGDNLGMMIWSVSGDSMFYNTSLVNCQALLQAFPLLCELRGSEGKTTVGNYVRYQCPVSCGCNDVSSGLYVLGTPYFGCPHRICYSQMQVRLANNSRHLKCEDRAPRQLRANLYWQRLARILSELVLATYQSGFLRHTVNGIAVTLPQAAAHALLPGSTNSTELTHDQIYMMVTLLGCGIIKLLRSVLGEQETLGILCMDYHHAASFYCPESCGCKLADTGLIPAQERCPASCFEGSGLSSLSAG